jgi:PAS domain S-box-containing protein
MGESLVLKWMILLTLFTAIPLIVAGLSILQIYHEELKGSFIAVEGIVLVVGILSGFLLARKLTLPVKKLSIESSNHLIQDSRQSKGTLKEDDKQYRRIFEDSKDMIYMTSADGKVVDVNQAGVDLFGYGSKEEMMSVYVRDTFLYPEDRRRFRNAVSQEGFVKDFEVKLKRKDGTPIDVLITANVRKDDSGNLFGYEGIIKDISDRKRMEQELKNSEERFKQVAENAGEFIWEVNASSFYTYASPAVKKILGYEPEEVVGKRFYDFYPPDVREKLKRTAFETFAKKEAFRKFVNPTIHKNGSIVILETSATPILDNKGNPIGYRGLDTDVTERKQAEEAFRQSEERTKQLSQENAIMAEIGRIVSSTLNIEGVYERFAEELRKLIPFDRVSVNTMNPDRVSVTIAYAFGVKITDAQEGTFVKMERAIYENIVNRRSSVLIQPTDESELAERYPNFVRHFRAGLRSMIATPLIANDQVVGILHIQSLKPNAYTESDVRLADKVGGQIAGAIAHAQLFVERMQAEEALRRSEERYRTIIENIQDGYFEVDLAGNFIFVNDAECVNLGYSRDELIGMNNRRYTDKENAKKVFEAYNKVYRTGEPVKALDMEIIRKDGTKAFNEISVSLIRDSEGKAIGFRGIARDVTERKKMEEALREREERYRTLLETMEEGYYEVDLKGRFIFFNDALRKMHGLPKEEMLGMSNRQYMDEEIAKKVYKIFNQVYKTGQPGKMFEWEIIRNDDEKAVVESSIYLVRNAKGEPVGFRGITRDITERKQAEEALHKSEEKYRNILQNIEEGYYEVDLAGNFTFFNDSMCQIFGYPRDELMGMNDRQYTDPENAKKLFQAFNRVYKTGEPTKGFDWEIIRKDGTERYIEASVSLRKDSSGKPIGFRGIVRDITEKKRMEEQLLQAEKLRAVGEMASGVAHDFNNALAAILGNTQLLLYTIHDEELKETLKIIEKVAKDSSQTVRRLQDFTRKRVHQELLKVDINSIIKDSIEITKPKWKDEAQSRGICIEMVPNLEEVPYVSGNASELREVVTNMIFNAMEAMPEGGKIEIRTFKKRRDVSIQISDTGIGIAEEAKKKIFEPFFTTKPFTNTGLGLSMSYGIVKRFGGEIEVESEVGRGTTFTIMLPIREEEKEEGAPPLTIKEGRKARILVIDDEEFVRSILSRTLAQANHQVTLAEDGEKGVQLFKEGKFDIVLTDLGMPGVSGWEVCRMIKEMSPHTPVGMITGWGVEESRSKMEEYGLDFFISKPFDFNQILNVVAETMESKEG